MLFDYTPLQIEKIEQRHWSFYGKNQQRNNKYDHKQDHMGGNPKNRLLMKPELANKLKDLFVRLKGKGFMQIEIPWLIRDLFHIIASGEHCSITGIDQELEALGWGIGVLDNVTHKLVASLVANNGSHDETRYAPKGFFV